MSNAIAVVLAAGKGTRMNSELPKVLVEAGGRPLVEFVLDALKKAGVARSIVVVGYRGDDVRRALEHRDDVEFAVQSQQLGTGHAVQMCAQQLAEHQGAVVVLAGDSPMTQPESLRELLQLYEREHPACVLGTLLRDDPTGLGRIVRDEQGQFQAIVEEKDATDEQRAVNEVNMSTYVFDGPQLLHALRQLKNDNQQGEFYITDCPGILLAENQDVRALPVLKPCEALSVNTPDDLAAVEAELCRIGQVDG